MITQTDRATYTPQEYLDRELASETRSEYRNGKIFPMTGGTPDHNCISGNLYMALRLFLKRKPYEIFLLDQRLWIPKANVYTYPDVMVASKPRQLQPGRKDTVMNPCFIAEVLSNSTRNYDRGEKFATYRTIDPLREYVLIAQDRIHVEHYIKTATNQWLFSEYDDREISLSFPTFDLNIAIDELYEGVEFAEM